MALMYHPVLSSSPRVRQGDDDDDDDDEGFEQTLGALLSGKVRCFAPDTEQGQDCPHLRESAVLKYDSDTIQDRCAVEPDSKIILL